MGKVSPKPSADLPERVPSNTQPDRVEPSNSLPDRPAGTEIPVPEVARGEVDMEPQQSTQELNLAASAHEFADPQFLEDESDGEGEFDEYSESLLDPIETAVAEVQARVAEVTAGVQTDLSFLLT